MKHKYIALAIGLAAVLSGCGGGGDSGTSSSGGGSGSSGSGSGGSATSVLKPTQYAMYYFRSATPIAGAGAVSSPTATGANLQVDTGINSTLTVSNPSTTFDVSAVGFYTVSRLNGGLIEFCAPLASGALPGTTSSQYAAVATSSSDGTVQGTQLTNAVSLANKRLYALEKCSFNNVSGGTSQNQNTAPNSSSSWLAFDASGNPSMASGSVGTAAQFTTLLQGTASVQGTQTSYFTAYQFGTKVVVVERGVDTSTSMNNRVVMWVEN